ncbi:putative porin [Hymenobacter cheonanensis]|uniref:putative porin n=1 Tax=Hymenobacter sp. CA2-7 TaxID=3063993 RepID=UPI00271307FB|nr:putative porin [Hymenobacter sp. CA2-7]MDO7886381.1 putative porin [Hymenobacter sp. CA2-7]
MISFKNVVRGLLLLALTLGAALAGHAQIVDDSTKVLYGPKTTRVIYEAEVRRDSTGGTPIDTSLTRWPQARFWAHDTTFQQDLGVLGSASRPLLYQPNYQLGARFGRNAFDRNVRDGSEVPYYDSRSPYSFFRYIQGSRGEQVFEINYSRSLKKNFSIGVDYERIASNQVLAVNTTQWQVEHNNFTIYGRYQTEDGRYHLLANYSASRQRTRELGGIWPTATESLDKSKGDNSFFKYDLERVYLAPGINIDDRDQVHVFQSYRLAQQGFTAYHVLDLRRQYNGYTDNALPRDGNGLLLFYPQATAFPNSGTLRNTVATDDRATFRQIENTFGLLGRTSRLEYNVYGRYRNAWLSQLTTPLGRSGTGLRLVTVGAAPADTAVAPHYFGQLFVGGTASFNYRDTYAVEVAGEYLPYDNGSVKVLGAGGEYWLRGRIRTGPLSAELLLNSYSPTLTQRVFIGNNYAWANISDSKWQSTFNNTTTQQLTVRLRQRLPFLAEHSIELSAAAVRISGLVFYNQYGVPEQLSTALADSKTLLIGFARHRARLGSVFFDNQATYTQGGDGAGLRVPALVTESRVYYQRRVFGHALFAQVGGELYYQSRFRGYNYAPSTQQFYVQDRFTIANYAIANLFVAADISSASIFLKVAYLNQGLTSDGYFTTPYYTGYPRRFQFGVRWRFFS